MRFIRFEPHQSDLTYHLQELGRLIPHQGYTLTYLKKFSMCVNALRVIQRLHCPLYPRKQTSQTTARLGGSIALALFLWGKVRALTKGSG